MRKLIKMSLLAATLFTIAMAPLSQAFAGGYGYGHNYGGGYHGGGYYGHTYQGGHGYHAQYNKGYKHKRGYKKHRRVHRCETRRYRWSRSCRHYHGWRR